MSFYSSPPSLRAFQYDKPTLLVCWWTTIFCASIIVLRVAGRFLRTERLFREDKVAALALVPMFLRMACVHYVLRVGTNNADFAGVVLSAEELRMKGIASGLVLVSRILYSGTLWMLKDSILEFFRRLTGVTWSKTYEKVLLAIRCTLVATFAAVVVSTLAECRPFTRYWQVLPDPGGRCRQGYAHLITMAVCNVLTDLLLVFFPVPIILRTHMPVRRKAQLVLLFSLSFAVVAVTIYRVPHTIAMHGRQQYRSLLASIELLFATGAANSLVLGSFVRDRGLKKKKFDMSSVVATAPDSFDVSRRPTLTRHWGSDDNLVRNLGLGVRPALRDRPDAPDPESASYFKPAPMPPSLGPDVARWPSPEPAKNRRGRTPTQHTDATLLPDGGTIPGTSPGFELLTLSFHEIKLMPGSPPPPPDPAPGPVSNSPPARPYSPPQPSIHRISRSYTGATAVESPRPGQAPSLVVPASATGYRRGSASILQDLGGRLRPATSSPVSGQRRGRAVGVELMPIPQGRPVDIPDPELQDPGGLLGRSRRS